MINKELLIRIAGKHATADVMKELELVMDRYEINTPLRLCHFLAQVLHESACLQRRVENLNYSEQGLLATFPKYFTPEQAKAYARKPEMIANRVYANRMGNGPESSGDGWRYRGRGFIQITGKDNYQSASNDLGIDFVEAPEFMEQCPMIVSGWYWDKRKLNLLADQDDIATITRRVNGGLNGFNDRKYYFEKCKEIIYETT